MTIDLAAIRPVGETEETFGYKTLPAFDLVVYLCMEAGVCVHTPGENDVEIHAATWDVENGLQVTDHEGKVWRLCIKPEPVN